MVHARAIVLAFVALLPAACKRPAAPAPPDAAPLERVYPDPAAIKRQIEQTLEKEHEKTLAPRVE